LVVFPMCLSFAIRCQQVYVKHGVNAPLMGELEPIRDWGHHLSDNKRSVTSRGQFASRLIGLEVTPIQPYTVTYHVFGRVSVLNPQLLRSDHVCLGILSYLKQVVETSFHQW
jgi:hypothetical protein